MVPAYTGAGLVPVLQRRGSRSAGWVMGSAELFERAGMGDVFCGCSLAGYGELASTKTFRAKVSTLMRCQWID
jgi:hypothetical protein